MLFDATGRPISEHPDPTPGTGAIGITRSFSYKLNLGDYQSADFFCSQRAECSPDMAQEVSRDLDQFCQDEVAEAIKSFKLKRARKESERAQRSAS